MDRQWLPLNALRAFEAAGHHLSFTAAAGQLRVAQSAVSRHVIVLERFLGTALFERRPQQLALTEAGRHLLPVVTRSFDRIDQALGEIIAEGGTPKRVLRVGLPPTFAHQLAIPILRDFRSEHGDITIEIVSKPAEVEGEVEIAIIYAEPRVSDSIQDLLWRERPTLLCSPAVASAGGEDIASFIAGSDLLHVKLPDRPRHYIWELFARSIGRPDLPVGRGLVFDTAQLAIQYALSGDGLALVDPILFREELQSGRLVRPFPQRVDAGFGYYLTTSPQDLDGEPVALFRSWLIKRFSAEAHPADPEDEPMPKSRV